VSQPIQADAASGVVDSWSACGCRRRRHGSGGADLAGARGWRRSKPKSKASWSRSMY